MKYINKIILIIFLGFISCETQEEAVVEVQNLYEKNLTINPLEYIGIEHNLFMEEFTSLLISSKNEWKNIEFLSNEYETKFSSIMNDAYHTRYLNSNSTISSQKQNYNDLNTNEWFDGDDITSVDIAENVLIQKATYRDRIFTMNLLTDIFNAIDNGQSDLEGFNALEKIINKHENLILSENWEPEEKYALGALSVAKHSTMFWKKFDLSAFNNSSKSRNPRSSIIVGADVAGYVIGGVVGGTAGSFAGPAGTVGGVLGGKAGGAWLGSAAAATAIAIYDAWSDFFS